MMLRKILMSSVIYPAVIVLFALHFMMERKGLARLHEISYQRAEPSIDAINLPETARTEQLLLPGTPDQTVLYITESEKEGPVILVIGGIHGNEPAGSLAAESIATWVVDRGTLLVIPRANVRAISAQTRCAPGSGDLNRSFPGIAHGDSGKALARAIYNVMAEFRPQWVIDLHEAREFEYHFQGALGQTIIYPRNSGSLDVVSQVIATLNEGDGLSEYGPFILRRGAVEGGTISSAISLGLDGFMVETCWREPLEARVSHHLRAVSSLLQLMGVTIY